MDSQGLLTHGLTLSKLHKELEKLGINKQDNPI